MRETDSIDKKLFRDTIAQYVTEESDPDKVDYVHRLILLTIGDHEERDEFRYGRPEADPVSAHGSEGNRVVSDEDDDMPSALDSYLDEIAGLDDWKGQEESPSSPNNQSPQAYKPTPKPEPKIETKDAGQDVTASNTQPTSKPTKPPEIKSSKAQHPKRKLVTGRDDNKTTPFAKEIAEGKFALPLKDKNEISAELKKFGFTKEDFDLMKRYCSDHKKKPSFQWAKLLKAAYTDKRTYGTITNALLNLNGSLPKAKYDGFLKYEERFKRHSAWLRWLRAKEKIKSHYAAKGANGVAIPPSKPTTPHSSGTE